MLSDCISLLQGRTLPRMNVDWEKILSVWADLKIKYISAFQQVALSASLKCNNDGQSPMDSAPQRNPNGSFTCLTKENKT